MTLRSRYLTGPLLYKEVIVSTKYLDKEVTVSIAYLYKEETVSIRSLISLMVFVHVKHHVYLLIRYLSYKEVTVR